MEPSILHFVVAPTFLPRYQASAIANFYHGLSWVHQGEAYLARTKHTKTHLCTIGIF